MARILIGFVLSFLIGAACRYFYIPATSPPVIRCALIVLAMTLGYSSMDRVVSRRQHRATTKSLCGAPTRLPVAMMKNAAADENSREGRRSARHFVNVDMSDVINSATLFPLSNLPMAVRLLLKQLFQRNEWRQLTWQADLFAIRRQTIC